MPDDKLNRTVRQREISLSYGELYYIFSAANHDEFMDRVWKIFCEHMKDLIAYHEEKEKTNNE